MSANTKAVVRLIKGLSVGISAEDAIVISQTGSEGDVVNAVVESLFDEAVESLKALR